MKADKLPLSSTFNWILIAFVFSLLSLPPLIECGLYSYIVGAFRLPTTSVLVYEFCLGGPLAIVALVMATKSEFIGLKRVTIIVSIVGVAVLVCSVPAYAAASRRISCTFAVATAWTKPACGQRN